MESVTTNKRRATDNVCISYTGLFDSEILTILAQGIEGTLTSNDKVTKKVFKIFLELAQNISQYSLEREPNSSGE